MKEYEAIILILYSENENLYRYNKLIWEKYMNSNNKILSLFIKYDNSINEDIKLIENKNLLLIRGEEKYDCLNIFNKTIKSFKYCHENYNYKYIIRTNISSFWIYDKLLNYLNNIKNNFIYGWKVNTTINNEKIYFISGTGIIIPYNLVPMIFDHDITTFIMDDIEISQFYLSKNIELKDARRNNINYVYKFEFENIEKINVNLEKIKTCKEIIYFRVKSTKDRENNDKYILDNLLLQYYNKKVNIVKNKLHLFRNYDNIKIFKSKKALSYSKYIVDIIEKNIKKNIINTRYENDPDIIITHITERTTFFNMKSLNIIISGESRDINQIYDIYIGTNMKTKASINLYIPYLYLSLTEHKDSINYLDYKNNKQNFCAYMYFADKEHRIKYFNLLNNYKKVDALGKSCNNIINNYSKTENFLDDAIKLYTNYKFTLALENFLQDGYITEKIINSLIAGSIPIYWGSNDVFKYINKNRVIYIMDYNNDQELIERITEIDNSDILYNEIISEPIYTTEGYPIKIFTEIEENIKYLFN